MITVLFVCTGNTCRSPMAEAIMGELIDDYPSIKGRVQAQSAGTMACEDARIVDLAEESLELMGIDASRHKARQITREMADEADLILTMDAQHIDELLAIAPEAEEKTHTLKGYVAGVYGFPGDEDYDIIDPFRQPLEDYVDTQVELTEAIKLLLQKLSDTYGQRQN